MEAIETTDSLEEYQRKMAHNRKIKLQAQAIIKRAKNAGIPDKYLRINQSVFESLLDQNYHSDIKRLSEFVYKHPLNLMKREFIVIDGGGVIERKMAGFAILFRLIACDKCGMCKNGTELAHQLQSIRTFEYGAGRNDIAESLREADILFISECLKGDFVKNFETGRFFDEILNYRDDHTKPTIVSLSNPIPINKNHETLDNVMTEMDQYGQYMCSISQADISKDKRFLRIRVTTNGK